MKYFRMSEWDIKWELSWDNYVLYLSSIPSYDTDEDQEVTTVHASEIF